MNELDNCEFIAGDVLQVLDTLADKPDVIVVDPPRAGINYKALPKILKYGDGSDFCTSPAIRRHWWRTCGLWRSMGT